jgi:Sortilin, neurotensin receptor 3,
MLLVGTEKGLFRIRAGAAGGPAQVDGPHLTGYRVKHVIAAPRQPLELLAAVDHPVWGSHIHRSVDGGVSWTSLDATPQHPPGRHAPSLQAVWHLAWCPDGRRLYAGIDPAGLFVSDDDGASWRDVPALNDHATRAAWEPSRGLFALHSICVDRQDPRHVVVAVSAGGVYRSVDGGASWQPANAGVRAENLPERFPLAGHNVHRVVMHPLDGRRLYRQCYNGTYRSNDGGVSWTEITSGLPSDFGYAIACDPFAPDTVWQIPESSSHVRTAVDGKLRVFRSVDAGRTWVSASAGLPQQNAYVTVLRDAMEADPQVPGHVAFGTSSGHVFLSRDHGDAWNLVAEFLPRVLSVRFVAAEG